MVVPLFTFINPKTVRKIKNIVNTREFKLYLSIAIILILCLFLGVLAMYKVVDYCTRPVYACYDNQRHIEAGCYSISSRQGDWCYTKPLKQAHKVCYSSWVRIDGS